jgi:thiamine biosynthesis lipoprotein
MRTRFRSMGTTIDVVADRSGLVATQRLFDDLEHQFSRFLPDSELTAINRDPSDEVELSARMASVIRLAAEFRYRTGGLVDPAVGAQVSAWGYDRSFSEIADRAIEPPEVDPVRRWSIEGDTLLRQPGTRFDLGGIVKGWAADLAVETGMATVVSAGGDVRSSDPDTRVEIEDPAVATPTVVELGSGGLATSSVARRRWRVGGDEAHHLIDPRTGSPAISPIVSATARCATAVEAEAAAKAVILLGRGGLSWADDQEWIASALVSWHDGSVFATHGWEYAA